MKLSNYIIFFTVLLITGITNAQMDSVYHQGPKLDSVITGAIQSTDNFTATLKISTQQTVRIIPNKTFPKNEMFINVDESKLPHSVYIEDKNVTKRPEGVASQTVLLNNFPGYDRTNAIPPDPTIAVGPNHVILCANGFPSTFRIYDKAGNLLKSIAADDWWADVSPGETGDPQVMYDPFDGIWVLGWMYVNTSTQQSATLIAYSDDDDPLGTWYVYSFPLDSWGDYPQLGFDDEAIYINTHQFSFAGSYQYVNMRIINKAELYTSNGGQVKYKDIWDIRRPADGTNNSPLFGIHPTYTYSSEYEGYHFWSSFGGANFYCLFQVINPTSNNPRLRGSVIPVETYLVTPDADQLGGGDPLIESGGSSCRTSPILKDGFLFMTHSIGNSTNSDYASVKYVILDVNTTSIVEQAELGAIGYYYIYPTLAIDQDYNIAVTFSRSADDEYIGAYYSTKYFGDSPGLSPSRAFAEGQGNYVVIGSGSRNRWGDYMGIYLDPANNYDIWMHTEYAASTNTWGTKFAQIRLVPYTTVHTYVNPISIDFGDVEVGAASQVVVSTLANYGIPDLIINNIPSTVGEFKLENNLTFPITRSTYDSLLLYFTFNPTVPDSVQETFLVSSNDPNFSGFTLSGHGFVINPALDRVMYSSSGSQNEGNILSVVKETGEGTNIGPSLFDDILGITISPLDKKLYAVRSTPSESEILKVNSLQGDSYVFYTFDLPNMAAISFDTSGTLYGALETGEIYHIDLINGTYDSISTAPIEITAITFDPVTNVLWATQKGGFGQPKDKIYKIDLITGDTTLVGQTGFHPKATNDLAFDENGVLYGIIGTGPQVSDLFTIDINTGEGTIIGSVGLKALTGLAYAETGVVSVEKDENKNTIPADFVLSQNYPNPFNPSTSIEFSVPVNSTVTITIYNLLGQAVTELVNEEIGAGNYSVMWNGADRNGLKVSSGIYLYKMQANGNNGTPYSQTKKMILLK